MPRGDRYALLAFTLGQRLDGVVNQVDEDASYLLGVEQSAGEFAREQNVEPHAFESVFVERDGLTHDLIQVRGFESRVRQTREARELVNHRLEARDLAADGRGALLDHARDSLLLLPNAFAFDARGLSRNCRPLVFHVSASEVACDALGGELDGRERVLYLVRETARDLAPGGCALRGEEFRQIFDDEDDSAALGVRARGERRRRQSHGDDAAAIISVEPAVRVADSIRVDARL